MAPSSRHTPGSRDRALRRLHRITAGVAVGGFGAVGVVTYALAASAPSTASASASSGGSSSSPATTVDTSSSTSSRDDSSLGTSQTVTTPSTNSLPQAVSGGSGH